VAFRLVPVRCGPVVHGGVYGPSGLSSSVDIQIGSTGPAERSDAFKWLPGFKFPSGVFQISD
jgi:hypothetical protein